MNTAFRKSFTRDLRKVKNQSVRNGVQRAIEEVEAAAKLEDVNQVKNLRERQIAIAFESATTELELFSMKKPLNSCDVYTGEICTGFFPDFSSVLIKMDRGL